MIRKRRLTETQRQEKQSELKQQKQNLNTECEQIAKPGWVLKKNRRKGYIYSELLDQSESLAKQWSFHSKCLAIRQRCRLLFPNFNFTLAPAVKTFFLTQLRAETVKWKWKIDCNCLFGGALCQHGSHNNNGHLSLLLRMIVAGKIQETHSQQNPQGNHFLLQGAMSDFSPLEAATEHSTCPKTKNMELVPFTSDWVSITFLSISQYLWMSEPLSFCFDRTQL